MAAAHGMQRRRGATDHYNNLLGTAFFYVLGQCIESAALKCRGGNMVFDWYRGFVAHLVEAEESAQAGLLMSVPSTATYFGRKSINVVL